MVFTKVKAEKYFVLSPRWKDDKKQEVIFLLNPYDQRRYNHGWYTVQELLDWANDKGPVIINKDNSKQNSGRDF